MQYNDHISDFDHIYNKNMWLAQFEQYIIRRFFVKSNDFSNG
jgi:hypothetical protein